MGPILLLPAALSILAGFVFARRHGAYTIVLGVAVGLIFALLSAVAVVPAGHVGVRVLFGRVIDVEFEEGLHIKNPFEDIVPLSVRTETYDMTTAGQDSTRVLSKDGLQMPLDVTVAYRLLGNDAPWIYRNIGEAYEVKLIRSAARTAVREAAAKFTAQEAYASKREALSMAMETILRQRLADLLKQAGLDDGGFTVQQVLLRNVSLPDRVAAAIQEKLAAEQEAQRMEFVLDKERKEAERKAIEAEGIKTFQTIVREGIDDKLLKWKGIEATRELAVSQNAKVVIVGGSDGLPVILNTGGAAQR